MVTKECIICGKEFTPYYNMIDRQKCCSKDCHRVYNHSCVKERYKNNRASALQKAKQYMKVKNKVLCRLCGQPVEILNSSGYRPRYHEKCIFDDCAKVIKRGEKLSAVQYKRLQARGYRIADVKDYIDGWLKIIS